MGCGVYWNQVKEIERAMGVLRKYNILETSEAYRKLAGIRAGLLKQVGLKFPRTITQVLKLVALSPGSLNLFHDIEGGWLVETRVKAGALPVYHYVKDDVAMTLLKGGLTHELEAELMTPDNYVGE